MHVLQWIAVQHDDKDLAFRAVRDYLETNLGEHESYDNWYDWFVVGGGRWNVAEDESWTQAYVDKTNMIISYDDEPERFRETVSLAMNNRKEEFDRYAKDVDPEMLTKIISGYHPSERDFSSFSDLYPIKKIVDMAYGEWDFNSYFFDCNNDTTTDKYMFESIDKGNKNWYLVPVDFHF